MADQLLDTPQVGFRTTEGNKLESAVVGLGKDLKRDLSERGILSLDELLNKVYYWENIHGEKLGEGDFEVLSILSMVLGTAKMVLDKKVGVIREEVPKSAFLGSAQAQQEILKTVLANLGEDGRPNKSVIRSLSLVAEIFEDYFNPEKPRLETSGLETEAGFWQGIQGAMTTAFLFREAGWEVRFPPPQFDVKWGVDLIARDPDGRTFAIGITAKTPRIIDRMGRLSEPFYVERKSVSQDYPRELAESLDGYLKINVPPLSHSSSHGFYENRVTCYPGKGAVDQFTQMLKT
jgi:hypothetical protein